MKTLRAEVLQARRFWGRSSAWLEAAPVGAVEQRGAVGVEADHRALADAERAGRIDQEAEIAFSKFRPNQRRRAHRLDDLDLDLARIGQGLGGVSGRDMLRPHA